MEPIREGLERKIQQMLAERRRSAFLENLSLSLLYSATGFVLTLFSWFLIFALFSTLFQQRRHRFEAPTFGLISVTSLAIFAGIVFWKRRDLLREGEFADPTESWAAESSSDTGRSIYAFGALAVSGPRFFVLAIRALRAARQIRAVNLLDFIRPIALAVQRRGKIRESDLLGLPMAWFLAHAFWIDGFVPLLRKPQGFVVSEDFIREALGPKAYIPEPEPDFAYRPPPRDPEPGPELDSAADEFTWALNTLGLARGATRAQVNAAYRKFAKLVHPDLHAQDPSVRQQREEQMKDLNLAYEILRRQIK